MNPLLYNMITYDGRAFNHVLEGTESDRAPLRLGAVEGYGHTHRRDCALRVVARPEQHRENLDLDESLVAYPGLSDDSNPGGRPPVPTGVGRRVLPELLDHPRSVLIGDDMCGCGVDRKIGMLNLTRYAPFQLRVHSIRNSHEAGDHRHLRVSDTVSYRDIREPDEILSTMGYRIAGDGCLYDEGDLGAVSYSTVDWKGCECKDGADEEEQASPPGWNEPELILIISICHVSMSVKNNGLLDETREFY